MARQLMAVLLAAACSCAAASQIALIGVIGNKAAVLALDGGEPKTVKLGQTWNGITVREVQHNNATIELDGKKQLLTLGAHHRTAVAASAGLAAEQASVFVLDDGGQFFADGLVNGKAVHLLIDTGASVMALPAKEAQRLGIDYAKGRAAQVQTAGGLVSARFIILERVRVAGIELNGVEAVVVEQGLSVAILGMSFLNRVDMHRKGNSLTLVRR